MDRVALLTSDFEYRTSCSPLNASNIYTTCINSTMNSLVASQQQTCIVSSKTVNVILIKTVSLRHVCGNI